MTRADDEVEFLDDSADGEIDEELPQHVGPRPRPWMVRVAVGAAALLVTGAVVRAATDRPDGPRAAAPKTVEVTPSATTLPAVPTRERRRDFDASTVPKLLVPPACPQAGDGLNACVTSHVLPEPLLAAVRAQFPGAKPIAITTEVVRPAGAEVIRALWSRAFTAQVGTVSLHVVVSAGVDRDTVQSNSFDDGIRVRTETWYTPDGSLVVQVFTSAPSGRDPAEAKVRRLSQDPRLLRIS